MKTPFVKLTLAEAFSKVDKDQPLFCDTETCGLYGKVRLLQLYQKQWDEVVLVEWPDLFTTIANLVSLTHVWHNAPYDITTLQLQSGMTNWCPETDSFEDTLYLSKIAKPHLEKYSLDAMLSEVLGYDPYDRQKLNKTVLQKTDWSKPVLTNEQLLYAATDVYYMPALYEAVEKAKDSLSYELDKKTMCNFFNMQHNGMPVDADILANTYEDNATWLKENSPTINVNSWQQVRKWIGCTESNDEALSKMELKDKSAYEILTHEDLDTAAERASIVRKTRKVLKQQNFLTKFDSERIYGKFTPGTNSGRAACRDQNLQQIPRALKKVFSSEGYLIFADYAQLELRTICALLNVSKMVTLFREGKDLHTFTAEMLFGADFKPEQRLYAKGANFGLLYGAGAKAFVAFLRSIASVIISEVEANRIKKKWLNLWTEIAAWQQRGIKKWRSGQLGYTPLGRPYKARLLTDFLNLENQGAGAEVARLALIYIERRFDEIRTKHNLDKHELCVCNFIHDSYIIEYLGEDMDILEEASIALAECMQLAWFEMSKLYKVKDLPMPVDVRAGRNWKEIDSDDGEVAFSHVLEPYAMMEKANG